jgi:signal transduction histidine kinase/DNA-binding response OmpR family regulator
LFPNFCQLFPPHHNRPDRGFGGKWGQTLRMENKALLTNPQVRVLVVDDHPNTATTLARAISQLGSGVDVVSATSGKAALKKADEGGVDLLITDMMMPDMNGLELIETLQSHPGGRPAYTVLVTAYDVPGLKETARRLKVNETIIKPVRPERICQIVSDVLDGMGHSSHQRPAFETQIQFKILVADDRPDNVALLSRYLQNEGYALVTASNGAEALQRIRTELPDLVLLDVNMPEKDGFEVLREVRADSMLEHIPVIILTAARIDPADMQSGLNLGADDYVTKPFDRRELMARIHTKLRVKEAEDVIRRRNRELNVLPEIGKQLSARLDINELTDVILHRTVETLGAMLGYIIILNPTGPLQKEYHISTPVFPTHKVQLPHLNTLLEELRKTQWGMIIDDAHNDPRWPTLPDDPTGSVIVIPMFGRLDLIGFLALIHEQPGYFNPDHQLLLQAISAQAAIAVENARLYASVMREQQRSSAILQSAPDVILMFDPDGRLALLNPTAEKLFTDYRANIGQPLMRGHGYDALISLLEETLASGKPKSQEVLWPDHRAFSVYLTPIPEGGCVVILHDVTHFKDLERVKNDFISTASHDLKNPISIITGACELMPRVGPLNKKQSEFVNHIYTAANNMNELVHNMLQLVTLDAGSRPDIKSGVIDLYAVMGEVVNEFQPLAKSRGQSLVLEGRTGPDLKAGGDPWQLRQVLRNLVNNALKYTPRKGSITLSLEASGRQAIIAVQDTGYGIPPADLPFIFDRFYRVRNMDTKGIEGHGLGLAIVKSVVEQHGGQVCVESQPGKGSRFTFSLPLV